MKLSPIIRGLLFATALTPIVFSNQLLYPYTFGKVLFFRILIEIATVLFLVRFVTKEGREDARIPKGLLRSPIAAALLAFLASAFLSTVFAVNRYHAFWGDIQWGDGFFALLHYALFFFLLVSFFGKKEWELFFGISLGVGAVAILYAWLQYWGISHIPFALTPTSRPGSFLDNPSFFSAYLLFLIGIAFLVGRSASGWRRYISFAVGVSAFLTLFIVNVRGGIVGFAGGVAVFTLHRAAREFRENGFSFGRRSPAMTSLLAAVVLLAGLLFTRHAALWGKIPGFGRLVQISVTDSSAQTRLIALRVSWEAFLEKPLLGWGLENYNVGYNKHYNPDYALYEEAWFDRAHNKLAEIGVTQGLLGLLAYGALILACVRVLRRETFPEHLRPVVVATLSAYFIQNFFLFDVSTSYIMLIAFLALMVTAERQFESRKLISSAIVYPSAIFGIAVLVGFLYFANLVPFYQSSIYREALAAKVGDRFLAAAPRFLKPYTFLQSDLRPHFADVVATPEVFQDPKFDPLVNIAFLALEETTEREANYEPRNFLALAEALNERAKQMPELFKRSEEYLRRALELSPKRQDIYYVLGISLSGQGRFDDAIQTMRDAVALNPNVAKAHYNLGVELALAGKPHWDEAEEELARAQDIGFVALLPEDARNISTIYKEMLYAYIMSRDAARVVRVAERFKKLESDLAQDMDTIISLAKSGDWAVLIKAVEASSGGN